MNHVKLSDLDDKTEYDRVTVKAKVIRMQDPVKVSASLHRQNVTIKKNYLFPKKVQQ